MVKKAKLLHLKKKKDSNLLNSKDLTRAEMEKSELHKSDLGNFTVSLARSNMFYPSLKLPKKIKRLNSVSIENDWYKIEFDQLMDQTDFNIITSIISMKKHSIVWEDGSMGCFFNLSEVQRFLNIKSRKKHSWFKKKLLELRKINITIKSKQGYGTIITGIIRKLKYINPELLEKKSEEMQREYKIFNDGRHVYGTNTLFFVQFESEFIKMIHEDINIYCNKLMHEILKIKSGTIQAIIKFLLTHKNIQMQLDKLLYTIGIRTVKDTEKTPGYIYVSEQRYKQIKSEIRKQKEILKDKFGIEISDDDLVKYKQHKDVWYSKVKIPKEITYPIRNPVQIADKGKSDHMSTTNE